MINTFLLNRNLLTTLKGTIEFLQREPRINIYILDQDSTYPPLLEYYNTLDVKIHYFKQNAGQLSPFSREIDYLRNNEYFIITDPDCIYDGVPDDWLDVMLNVLNNVKDRKVGFSLRIDDLPDSEIGRDLKGTETRFWKNKNEYGWLSEIDTTFALYHPHSAFIYEAIRLDEPYCIKHYPWYITRENINEEWLYYINNSSHASTISGKIRNMLGKDFSI